MSTWSVKTVALLVSGLMWVSAGLAPVLGFLQDAEASEGKPVPVLSDGRTQPRATSEQSEESGEEGDESSEEGAWAGSGLSDLMSREPWALKSSPIAAPAELRMRAPSRSSDHSRRFIRSSRLRFVPCAWGQRAHWPCGPPVG